MSWPTDEMKLVGGTSNFSVTEIFRRETNFWNECGIFLAECGFMYYACIFTYIKSILLLTIDIENKSSSLNHLSLCHTLDTIFIGKILIIYRGKAWMIPYIYMIWLSIKIIYLFWVPLNFLNSLHSPKCLWILWITWIALNSQNSIKFCRFLRIPWILWTFWIP